MPGVSRADVLIVSLGSTAGLRASDAELAESMRRAGAQVRVAAAEHQPRVRTLAYTDWRWARAARAAAVRAIDAERPARDRLLDDDRRAALAASRARSASTRPPPRRGPAATASGSARASAGGCARRRC